MPTRDECIIYLVLASTSFVFNRVMVGYYHLQV